MEEHRSSDSLRSQQEKLNADKLPLCVYQEVVFLVLVYNFVHVSLHTLDLLVLGLCPCQFTDCSHGSHE